MSENQKYLEETHSKLFAKLDLNGDGKISESELKEALIATGIPTSRALLKGIMS